MGFDIEKSFIMAERLKQLREGKGLSHEKLSKALSDQYGVKISSDSLINYEVANADHTKAYKNQGMRVEYLRCLADFYGVSSDYILGMSDVKTQDSDIKELVAKTGLSEDTILTLHGWNNIQAFKDEDPSKLPNQVLGVLQQANSLTSPTKAQRVLPSIINTLVHVVTKRLGFYSWAFNGFSTGMYIFEKHFDKDMGYLPDEKHREELLEHGYVVIDANRFATWSLDQFFEELKYDTRKEVFQNIQQQSH